MKDFLIVGFGLAGLSMASVLDRQNKTFDVIDVTPNNKHRVVGGMYNPVILKRFSPAWRAHEMWQQSLKTYRFFEQKFNKPFIKPFKIYRILHAIEEQNNWIVASDKAVMSHYMNPTIINKKIDGIDSPFGLGELNQVGRVEGELILEHYTEDLRHRKLLKHEQFDYQALVIDEESVSYQGQSYKNIIFSEGSFVVNNPYINYLPMKLSKGEMLIIYVPDLKVESTIKSKVFMVPLGNQMFIVGSTYHWDERTNRLTVEGKEELETKLRHFLKLPYTVVDYKAGVRPTVSDRRPLIGQHPEYKQVYVLNGLGTRGIIYAPALAEILYDFIEHKTPIDYEMNIDRFKNYYNN